MFSFIFSYISRYSFLLLLKFNIIRNQYDNFKDLNFKQNDFINYKVVKQNILKDNFIYDSSKNENHTFNFLLFYQKLGGKRGIELSKKNIFSWFKKYKNYIHSPWVEDYASKRFINIIYNYDYICSISNQKEIKYINFIINFHIKRIILEVKHKKIEDLSSYELLAEILIACIKNNFNFKLSNKLIEFLNLHIDENSVHKSYNILSHAKFINNLNEIKNILLFFNFKSPENLTNKILAMTSMLSTYRHQDSSLPLFNGCNNNHNQQIERILSTELFLKTKPMTRFKNGIAVYRDTNKALFFDVIQPSKFNYHKELSAGSLALEISALGEKIITNCGGAEINAKNSTYLKYTAAHSTIVINNTNISEIREGNINKTFPKKVIFDSKDLNKNIILTGTHNGYLKNYSKICKRELIINTRNDKFQGKDTIISAKSLIKKYVFHIRFHLTPSISTIITENKKNIIIRTKKNNMWLFKSDNEVLIEKSIYVEKDIAIETSQIVITGITSALKNKVTWSLEKI